MAKALVVFRARGYAEPIRVLAVTAIAGHKPADMGPPNAPAQQRTMAVGLPGLLGSQPFGAGQSTN